MGHSNISLKILYFVSKDLDLIINVIEAVVELRSTLDGRLLNLPFNHAKVLRQYLIFELINEVVHDSDFLLHMLFHTFLVSRHLILQCFEHIYFSVLNLFRYQFVRGI